MLFVFIVAGLLLAVGFLSCFILFLVLLLYLVEPLRHTDHLVGEEGAGGFAFLLFFGKCAVCNI